MPHGSYGPATGDRRCTIPIPPTIRNSIMPNVLKEKLMANKRKETIIMYMSCNKIHTHYTK